ncbi:MAG: CRISPR-associated helicase Cas3' [Bryobacteraceae bacterium]
MREEDDRLLAKSRQGDKTVDLAEHSRDVYRAAVALFGTPDGELTRLGAAWVRAFRVQEVDWRVFLRTLTAAAWLHDLGKANSGFQKAVRGRGEQTLRHEQVSALLMFRGPLREWLEGVKGVDVEVAMAAVLSHHVKASDREMGKGGGAGRLKVHLERPEVATLLTEMCIHFSVDGPPFLENVIWDGASLDEMVRKFQDAAQEYRRSDKRRSLNAAVKCALMASDALGSAMTRVGVSTEEWVGRCFGGRMLDAAWLDEHILGPRQKEVAERTKKDFVLHGFQEAAGELGPRALLMSACGSGKTLAAWNWVRSQLKERPAARVIFLYPTRATATEGFRDYVSHAGGENAALLHGTAAFDLETLFENPDDGRSSERYVTEQRLFALGHWDRVAFSATVDQFLGFLAWQYGSLCLLPLLVDSVVVIDEVHAFDRSLFGHLETFLRFFDIPVLCMTATLTKDLLRILEKCELQRFPAEEHAAQCVELQKKADAPRYQFRMGSRDEGLALAREARGRGLRVMWVVNTVDRCREVAESLGGSGAGVLCYHSRFRLRDRRDRHRDAIGAFRKKEACLLVATQVCEMSLDLDADVLITEVAPVSALIQRAGRCWRREPGNGFGAVFVYEPEGCKPYGTEEVARGKAFAEAMAQQETVSQTDMALFLETLAVRNPQAAIDLRNAPLFGDGMYACSAEESLREENEYTRDVVLDGDIEEYMRLRKAGKAEAQGLICPVPRSDARDAEGRLDRPPWTADSSRYDAMTGYRKK